MRFLGSLRNRLMAAQALLLLLVLVMALVGVSAIGSLERAVEQQISALASATKLSNGLVAGATQQIQAAEKYLQTPTPELERRFLSIGDSTHRLQHQLRRIGGLTAIDQAVVNQIDAYQSRVEVAYALAHALVILRRGEEARAQAAETRGPADSMLANVQQLSAVHEQRALARTSGLKRVAQQRRSVVWLLFFTALLLGLGSAAATLRSVDLPLHRLVTATERMGLGDLRPVDLGGMPIELAALGRSVNGMSAKLRSVVGSVVEESRQLSGAAQDYSAMSEELAATSSEISSAMVRVAGTAEIQARGLQEAERLLGELREITSQVTRAATRSLSLSQGAQAIAEQRGADTTGTTANLRELREAVASGSRELREIDRYTTTIHDFIDRVRQISSQGGVLALNASIEASRAGDQGHGFTVVADEIREIAQSSANAANDVTRVMDRLQEQLARTSKALEDSANKVMLMETTSPGVSRALAEITRAIAEMQTTGEQIAEGAATGRRILAELGERTGEVARSSSEHAAVSESVSAATQQQTASTEEMASVAARLSDAAQRLMELVREFRV